jgi:phosphonate transport system substrate-binding protein
MWRAPGRVAILPGERAHGGLPFRHVERLSCRHPRVRGEADAGVVAGGFFSAWRSEGVPEVAQLEVVWRSPSSRHCNFTGLDGFDAGRAARWTQALMAMDFNDPSLRPAIELEGVRRWLPSDRDGYRSLTEAMKQQGLLK